MPNPLPRRWDLKRPIIWAGCIASFALLLLILGAARLVISQPHTGLDWSMINGEIYAVEPGSPAAAADLWPGDTIVAIDGQPLTEGLSRYTDAAPGRAIGLSILRHGQSLALSLTPTSLTAGLLLRRLEPLLIALGFGLFSFAVWTHKPYGRQTILFLAFSHLGAAALTFGLLSSLGHRSGALGFPVALYFLSPVLIHFHLLFPSPRRLPGRRLVPTTLYGLALAGAALWVGSYGLGAGGGGYPLTRLGMRLYFATAVMTSTTLLLHTYLTASPIGRRRIRLVAFGTLLAFTPMTALAVLPEALTGTPFLPYELTFPFLLLIPLAYAYAIAKEDLFHIDRLVNRGVVYLTLILLLTLPALGLATALSHLTPEGWRGHPLIWTLFALAVGVAFAPLRARLQALADRFFYGGWYDYRTVVEEISRGLSRVADEEALAALLADRLRARIPMACACLWLIEAGEWRQVRGARCPASAVGHPPHQIVEAREPIAADGSGCPEATLWVPLRYHGQLRGALALGPKAGEEPFDGQDQRILATLGRQAAVAAENARLVTALRQRAEEIDRLHQELLTGREEERKRLAWELHDQVIQDLLALHFYLAEDPPPADDAGERWPARREGLRRVIDDLRQMCLELRPATLDDLGLTVSIMDFAEEFGEQQGLAVHLDLPPPESDVWLPEDIALTLFRTLQEALRNVVRHAEARQAWVTLEIRRPTADSRPLDSDQRPMMNDQCLRSSLLVGRWSASKASTAVGGPQPALNKVGGSAVVLTVQDDGRGFVVPRRLGLLTAEGHFGLAGLKERLAMVGGTLTVRSRPEMGTEVVAEIPLNRHLDAAAASQPSECPSSTASPSWDAGR